MDQKLQIDDEAPISDSKKGGWITFIFIAGAVAGTTVAGGGWSSNLIVYLIKEFHVENISAAQIGNVVNGCIYVFPVIGAIVADSVGCFPVISIASGIALLGTILLFITAIPRVWSSSLCVNESSAACSAPPKSQFAVLYAGLALASIGLGGSRFTLATMGADQHTDTKSQDVFFNWYTFTFYSAIVIGATIPVYIQDNISWLWGFGLCIAANAFALVIFLFGKHFYLQVKHQGSPYSDIARVVFAAFRKRNIPLSNKSEEYYNGFKQGGASESYAMTPTNSIRFLNRAALKTDGDIGMDGSVVKLWRLCTVQQVEDFKSIVRILPVWSAGILLGTTITMQASMTVLQALSMDRRIGPHFKIPAGSILVTGFISTCAALSVIDRFLLPAWQKLTGRYPTPFQRIGAGHILNVLSMVVSAIVEGWRLKLAKQHHLQAESTVPMQAIWLFPQLVLVGVGEACLFPAQVALYYQEFPASMKNSATAMISVIGALNYYLATILTDMIRRVTGWLPGNINSGRIDNLYWVLAVIGFGNFCYFLACAHYYKSGGELENGSGDTTSLPARKINGE
uniref:Uncharacterized protein n=1 Tax=Kalanchoe fedtschenkoi TaxID=63787 RepID=A0A7N0UM57_KALFE